MGLLTPNDFEYQLLSDFIVEALHLLGQDCIIYTPIDEVKDSDMDKILHFNTGVMSNILFADDLTNNKLKNKTHWSKETGDVIEAYIGLKDCHTIVNNSVIDITPSFYNSNSRFIVKNVFGQVNSTYLKVTLVPYRESVATSLVKESEIDGKVTDENSITTNRPKLNRSTKL